MGFRLRESDKMRIIKSLDGDEYRIKKSAYGFFEEITFYDETGEEIESFIPTDENADGVHEFEEDKKVLVEGKDIRAEFPFSDGLLNAQS